MTDKSRRMVILSAICFAIVGASTTSNAERALRIGTEGAYYPFNYLDDDGQLQGFDIDIANALCDVMEVDCKFVISGWPALIPGLRGKRFDAIVASMSITEPRKELVDFTDKYYQTSAQFVALKGSGLEISEEGLAGKRIGSQRDTTNSAYLVDNFADVADLKVYDTQEYLYLDLFSGRLDAALADRLVWSEWLKANGDAFEFVGEPFSDPTWYGEGIGIAVRQEDVELRQRLDEALAEILTDGTHEQINSKYFPFSIY
jgi:lysine-arginine-ornithine-binding protein